MKFKCKHCEKEYSSYQSRCNHMRRYHNDERQIDVNVVVNKLATIKIEEVPKTQKCSKCDKKFQSRQGKWSHEKICK